VSVGQLGQAAAAARAGLVVAERFGNAVATARWLRFECVHIAYWEGRWDGAMAILDETFSEVGSAHALSRFAFEMRGRIRLARDNIQGAFDDADAGLGLGRQAKDPQTLFPALSFAAVTALEQGRAHDAENLADELLALRPADHAIAHHISPLLDLVWVMAGLGRSEDLIEATRRAATRTLHVDAAEALAEGRNREAADMYARMGSLPNEAFARLRAATQLSQAGRRREADEQLQPALAFWRSVNAKRFVREAVALLPATA
jgi:tetratricopeptide (TPR) repeat protein